MGKLWRDARVALAGVCGGLFSVSVFLLAARVDSYYAYLTWREEIGYADTYDRGVEDLSWIPIALWHVVLSMVASLFMHRYLTTGRISTFLRWQAIGVVVLAGWGLTALIALSLDGLMHGNLSSIEYTLSRIPYGFVAKFVAVVFASNVLYGSSIQAASLESAGTQAQPCLPVD